MTRILYKNILPCFCFWTVSLNNRVVYSDKGQPTIKTCQDQSLLLGSDKNMAKVVGVPIGLTLHLKCGFCEKSDDFQPKIWYVRKRGTEATMMEVKIGMENYENKNRITLSPSHILRIANFTSEDCGVYTCKRLRIEDDYVFTYVVDGVFSDDIIPKFGKIQSWNEYKRTHLDLLNEKLEASKTEPFSDLREFNFTFRLMTSWEPWGPCDLYGKRKGVRRKLGKCTMHFKPFTFLANETHHQMVLPNMAVTKVLRYYLIDNYDAPCRSLKLNETFPRLSEILRKIPEFELRESCDDFVPVESDSRQERDGYKYRIIKYVAEKGHIILICPETTFESTVEWFKDKKLLNDSFRHNMAEKEEPQITIDVYNSMYILHATKKEEGVYSCTVDGQKNQKFDVRIVSQSKILNEEFIRYSIYLGFVLSMTVTCFCAGLCVAWHRRSSFADPLNLKDKRNDKAEERILVVRK